jgi:hypothetical protein
MNAEGAGDACLPYRKADLANMIRAALAPDSIVVNVKLT